MSEKPTPGPWVAKQLSSFAGPLWVLLWPDKDGTHHCRVDFKGHFNEADVKLIAEAGNVYHEYGLTPRELVEQRGVMTAALRHCENMLMAHSINRVDHEAIEDEALSIIRAALANTERKT